MKKKIFSLALALVLTLSMSTVAFAAPVIYTPVEEGTTFTLTKTYENENDVVVTETLTFNPVADSENPAEGNVTVASVDVHSQSEKITVTLPAYSVAGTYRYTITENDGTAAGVEYSDDIIHVIVLVGYDNDGKKLVIENTTSYIENLDGTKNTEFTNTFKSGSFSVAKEVTGNMANQNDEFEITVTLTQPADKIIRTPITVAGQTVTADQWDDGEYTTTLTLSHADGATTFSDIPVGVTVTVSENQVADKMNGYSYISTKIGEEDFTSLTIADDTNSAIVVTNEKTTEVDTGIAMDSMPYILLLAVACMGLIVFISKKRMMREY